MRARQLTIGTTPTTLLTLLGIPEGQRGSCHIKFQTPSTNADTIYYGDKNQQPMELVPDVDGEVLPGVNLKDLYLYAGTASQLLNVAVWQ